MDIGSTWAAAGARNRRDRGICRRYICRVKAETNPKPAEVPAAGWREDWAEIFRAAEQGKFPNRAVGVLEMAECIRQLRKSQVVPNSHPR